MGNTGKATGFWLSELTHPYYALVDQGLQVDLAAIQKGITPIDPNSQEDDDASNARFKAEGGLTLLKNCPALDDIDTTQYQAIVFAGGHGTMWDFPDTPSVHDKAVKIYEAGGVLAAICHGPAALIRLKLSSGVHLIKDKNVTGFSNVEEDLVGLTQVVPFLLEDELKAAQANYIAAEPWQAHAVVDGRLVTGQNPQSAEAVGMAVVKLLKENVV